MFAHGLEKLAVPSYTEKDLTPLASLGSLTSLTMKERPHLRSLDGIEAFPWLAHLGVHLARNLEDISALGRAVSPVLESLRLPSCRKVLDIGSVASCPSLRFFELSEGAEIPTVSPLAGLAQLEHLYLFGSTTVADCDLHPIMKLPRLRDFRMMNRRGYEPSTLDIEAEIARRG